MALIHLKGGPGLEAVPKTRSGRVFFSRAALAPVFGETVKPSGAPSLGDLPWLLSVGQESYDLVPEHLSGAERFMLALGTGSCGDGRDHVEWKSISATGGASCKAHRFTSQGRGAVVFSEYPPSLAPASLLTRSGG